MPSAIISRTFHTTIKGTHMDLGKSFALLCTKLEQLFSFFKFAMSFPSREFSPSVGLYKRSKARPVVDFPEPDSLNETECFAFENLERKYHRWLFTIFLSDQNCFKCVCFYQFFSIFCISRAPVLLL